MKLRSRLLSLILVITILVVPSATALAAEPLPAMEESGDFSDLSLIPIDENDSIYSFALDSLQLTPEEAKEMSIYAVSDTPAEHVSKDVGISTCGITISGEHDFEPFTIWKRNVGQYWTSGGTRMNWSTVVQNLDDENTQNTVSIDLYQFPDVHRSGTSFFGPGPHSYVSGFFDVQKGRDYHFIYNTFSTVKIWMFVTIY